MLWIKNNIGTIIVLIILSVIVAGIIKSVISDKRKGKFTCGGNCASCNMCKKIHSKSINNL